MKYAAVRDGAAVTALVDFQRPPIRNHPLVQLGSGALVRECRIRRDSVDYLRSRAANPPTMANEIARRATGHFETSTAHQVRIRFAAAEQLNEDLLHLPQPLPLRFRHCTLATVEDRAASLAPTLYVHATLLPVSRKV